MGTADCGFMGTADWGVMGNAVSGAAGTADWEQQYGNGYYSRNFRQSI